MAIWTSSWKKQRLFRVIKHIGTKLDQEVPELQIGSGWGGIQGIAMYTFPCASIIGNYQMQDTRLKGLFSSPSTVNLSINDWES